MKKTPKAKLKPKYHRVLLKLSGEALGGLGNGVWVSNCSDMRGSVLFHVK